MPAWIFQPQIQYFAAPLSRRGARSARARGRATIARSGYDHLRRGQDIAELIAALGNKPVVLVGWSLGVLDSLGYVAQYGDSSSPASC